MNLKEKENKHYLLFILKKVKIIFLSILIISILLIGFISGLLFANFFGTLDNPSEIALETLHLFGVVGLEDLKFKVNGILKENINIPINYIKGQFSNPKKMFIEIKFNDYQKLEYKRQEALEDEILISSASDYVPAKIKYDNKESNVKLRLKGDWTSDHLTGDKWSFRIKVKDNETIFGMKTFSIQRPESRENVYELIYHNLLRKENVLATRYDFIEVIINGENKGIYAIEEHFEKQLIEYNERREGVIIKFNEDKMWEDSLRMKEHYPNKLDWFEYIRGNSLNWFYDSEIESFKNLSDKPILLEQFNEAKYLLESFRNKSLNTNQVFDIDKLSRYFAINNLLSCGHASQWNNIRFYYNPLTLKLEPIGYDGACGKYEFVNSLEKSDFANLVFEDEIFVNEYEQELKRISNKSYLDNLLSNPEIKKSINIIHKDNPFYHYSDVIFYRNQELIEMSLENVSIKEENIITINREGFIELNKDLIIPKGFKIIFQNATIKLINNSKILSYSDIIFNNTLIYSPDNTGQGIVIYKSKVRLENVLIKNMNSEDSLNIINSDFEIVNTIFENCSLDCFDSDFSNGVIKNSKFNGCGNDCIDISGGKVEIKDVEIINSGDKGISIGEGSNTTIKNIKIDKSYIGVAVKDNSKVFIEGIEISDVNYSLAVYQKKSEYGSASLEVINISVLSYIVEEESELIIDGIIKQDKTNNVYEELY